VTEHEPWVLRAAGWIGAAGLALVAVLVLIDDRELGLRIAELGLVLVIGLALSAHLAFHRRWRPSSPTRRPTSGESR
jgi:hypothetical protein